MIFNPTPKIHAKLSLLAYRLTNNREEAKDIVQSVYEKMLCSKTNRANNHEALAVKITRDLCYDYIRHARMKRHKLNQLELERSLDLNAEIERRDICGSVGKLIDALPDKQRIVMQLRDIDELEFEEIGRLMDMDQTAVRMNLSRARKNIREQLLKIQDYGL